MTMLCIYHNADQDGECSAAIVRKRYPECKFFGMQYGDKLPPITQDILTIIMVDFSLPMKEMKDLSNIVALTWIDHHITAMQDYLNDLNLVLSGLQDSSKAACELTWEYFFPNQLIPTAVRLVGAYDVWNHKDLDVVPFHYGVESCPLKGKEALWITLLSPFPKTLVKRLIREGKVCQTYQEAQDAQLLKIYTYKVYFEGLECLVINWPGSPSLLAEQAKALYDYEAFISFSYQKNKWSVSLRSYNDKVNVAEIAKSRGGGGHHMAARFSCEELPVALMRQEEHKGEEIT
jgi:oligoribonuclease NrnB/cAMP/cGMP phosphodiesterase (DHH superfamily)